jgi:hypothetical protein
MMLFLCRQVWNDAAEDLPRMWVQLGPGPAGLRRRYRLCSMAQAVVICEAADGPALEALLRDSVPPGGHAVTVVPLDEGFCRETGPGALSFMLQLGWETQARALDGLWPEIVQALQRLETPLVSAAYRMAGRQEAVVFAETACADDLNHLAALRLLHGVAVEQIAVMRAL